jgi:hypothetical protein
MSSRAGLYTVERWEFVWIVPALLKWHLVSTYFCFKQWNKHFKVRSRLQICCLTAAYSYMDYTFLLSWVVRSWVQKLHKIVFPCLRLSQRDSQYQLSPLSALDFWQSSFPAAAAFLNLTDEHDLLHPRLNLPTIFSLLFYPLTKKRTFTSDIGILGRSNSINKVSTLYLGFKEVCRELRFSH